MGGEAVYNIWSSLDSKARIAFLRKETRKQDVILPEDVARYLAQVIPSNATLRDALIRLISYSSLTGTRITLNLTKRILAKFIDVEGPEGTVDPFQPPMYSRQNDARQATSPRECRLEAECSVIFGLMKTREVQKITRMRQHFEVNMRELERAQLARLDVHERALEIRATKRKQG